MISKRYAKMLIPPYPDSDDNIESDLAIDKIYNSFDEELEAREKNTARIRKRRDELYEELRRYRQEYTKIKQKLDSIGTCGECEYYIKSLYTKMMVCNSGHCWAGCPDQEDYCSHFERKT